MINGLFTFLVGILFILVMPRSFNNTRPLCGLRYLDFFSAEDRRVLHGRVMLDDPRKLVQLSGITPRRAVTILFSSLRVWGHFAINVVSMVPKGALSIYSPTIIKSLGGFDASTASLLSSVYNFGVCLLAIVVAWVSDRTAIRGGLCLICAVYSIIFSGVQFSLIHSTDVWLKYAVLTLLNSGMAVSQGIMTPGSASTRQIPRSAAWAWRWPSLARTSAGCLARMCLWPATLHITMMGF